VSRSTDTADAATPLSRPDRDPGSARSYRGGAQHRALVRSHRRAHHDAARAQQAEAPADSTTRWSRRVVPAAPAQRLDGSRLASEYLNELPDKQRTALVLRHVMGHSVGEIAELTGTSPNTVKDRLLRGAREMRRLIRRDLAIGTGKKGAAS
jgi:RNA polymerase sigma-70 factor (ECF subfamily)